MLSRVCLTTLVLAALTLPLHAGGDGWKSLFNGKDLTGWDTWLGRPAGQKDVVGLNNDPKNVYTVVSADGAPAIRISGEIFGAITTKEEFENYHLRFEFKWGEKKWPPREKVVRDSGLLYHCVGPQGAQGGNWMRSQECQIQERDCGDYYSVAGAIVDVQGYRKGEDSGNPTGPVIYKRGGKTYTVPSKESGGGRIIKDPDNEKKSGEWNTIELLAVGGTAVHIVNGKMNMILTNSRQKGDGGKELPLTRGKLQFQSEGAEVFYRNFQIRPLSTLPAEYAK